MPRLLVLLLLAANALAAGRELAPRPLLPSGEFTPNLSIAHAGGRFLAAWGTGSVYGALLDANGRRISPSVFLIAATEHADTVEVVGAGDSFAVFWADRDGRIQLTDVAPDGRILGSRLTELPRGVRVSGAWDGEHFLVVVFGEAFRPNASRALLLERDGTILHDIQLPSGIETAHIAVTPDGFLAFTGTDDSFFAHAVTHDGHATQVSAGDLPQQIASTLIDDETLLVVTATADGTMRSMVWKNGAKVSERIILTQHLGGVLPIHLMRGEGRHLLAFANARSGKIETMHLADDGAPLSEPRPASDARPTPHPDGASANGVLVVLHQRSSLVNSLTFAADGTAAPAETLSIRPAWQANPLIGAGGGSMIAVWEEEDPANGSRLRTAAIDRDFESQNIRELSPRGRLAARTLAWSGTEHLILYNRDGALYAARMTYDGNAIGEPVRIAEASEPRAAVTWAGDRWAIAWIDSGSEGIRYATMSRGGSVSQPRTLLSTSGRILETALAFDGTRVHLAWIQGAPFPIPKPLPSIGAFTTRLRRDGRIADATPLRIPADGPLRIAIASSSERVIVTVDENERTTIHAISAKARELLSSRTLVDESAYSAVTWDGYELFAAAATAHSLSVWRLGRDGSRLDDVRTTGTLLRFYPGVSIAASPSYDAVIGVQQSDAAVIYPRREMLDPAP